MTYEIKRIEHAVLVGTSLPLSWFRGHSRCWGNLMPRILRPEWGDGYKFFRPDVELSMLDSFQRLAPSVLPSLPARSELLLWLLYMQHHGTPTRLLDWSENILTALYFAVSADPGSDGELWVLYPEALNRAGDVPGMPHPDSKFLAYMSKEFMHDNPNALAEELGLGKRPKFPLAFRPPLLFTRMVVQQSVFTIHPYPTEGCEILDVLQEPRHLVKYVIPAASKRKLREDLSYLGITRGTIFPDLDGLSHTIIDQHQVIMYTPPDPPAFEDASEQSVSGLDWPSAPNPAPAADV